MLCRSKRSFEEESSVGTIDISRLTALGACPPVPELAMEDLFQSAS